MAKSKNSSKNKTKSSSKFVFWIIGLIAIGVVAFIFLFNPEKPSQKVKETIDYSGQPFLGKESAPVSIIEFGDYSCSHCKDFAEYNVPIIMKELVDTGKAKFYFFHDSFISEDSIRIAKFTESVYQELGNQAFWKFHDLVFKNQPEDPLNESMDVFDDEFLAELLHDVASKDDVKKVFEHYRSGKSNSAWQKDMDYAKKLGVTGTPTLFVNGKLFEGNTMEDLKVMVEKAAEEKGNE